MCSSASPSITLPKSNSIGHASLPGCSTTAWPPSWKVPSSKLVRVRMDGLKNTSATDLPFSSLPSLLRLNSAAWVSRASSSGRLQSCVFKKCFSGIGSSFARGRGAGRAVAVETLASWKNEKTQPVGWVFPVCRTRPPGTQLVCGFRSASTRSHARGHPGGACVQVRRGLHRARILARAMLRRKAAAALKDCRRAAGPAHRA